jgi:hypothetical protein
MFDKAIDFGSATEAERLARAFAAKWPTPNVRQAIDLCEAGRLSWVDVAALFARSFGKAEAEVAG